MRPKRASTAISPFLRLGALLLLFAAAPNAVEGHLFPVRKNFGSLVAESDWIGVGRIERIDRSPQRGSEVDVGFRAIHRFKPPTPNPDSPAADRFFTTEAKLPPLAPGRVVLLFLKEDAAGWRSAMETRDLFDVQSDSGAPYNAESPILEALKAYLAFIESASGEKEESEADHMEAYLPFLMKMMAFDEDRIRNDALEEAMRSRGFWANADAADARQMAAWVADRTLPDGFRNRLGLALHLLRNRLPYALAGDLLRNEEHPALVATLVKLVSYYAPEGEELIAQRLAHPDPSVRLIAYEAAGGYPTASMIGPLADRLRAETEFYMAQPLVDSLLEMKRPEAREALAQHFAQEGIPPRLQRYYEWKSKKFASDSTADALPLPQEKPSLKKKRVAVRSAVGAAIMALAVLAGAIFLWFSRKKRKTS